MRELLAAGAPVGAHWIADRQSGPNLLRYGSEQQRRKYLPGMARGEILCCIGMSEPAALVRSGALDERNRHAGLSQFLLELSTPGIRIQPIVDLVGQTGFNEVFFDDVVVEPDCLLGNEGEGWQQVTSELSLERSGPERYLSSFALFVELVRLAGRVESEVLRHTVGRRSAELWTLRQMSLSVAGQLAAGEAHVEVLRHSAECPVGARRRSRRHCFCSGSTSELPRSA